MAFDFAISALSASASGVDELIRSGRRNSYDLHE
jgi:hypothetical protein